MNDNIEDLKYPIGRFRAPENIDQSMIRTWIERIETFPVRLREEVGAIIGDRLNVNYRPGGSSIRQVIHHLPDSHMNAYIRIKLALTEERPLIRPYYEDRWAELPEAKNAPIEISLKLLENLHSRWCLVLKSLTVEDFNKVYIHPEHSKTYALKEVVGLYAWHGDHHLAHIKIAKGDYKK